MEFSPEALALAKKIITRYPEGKQKSALLPLLHLAQSEFGGWLSTETMDYVASLLSIKPVEVYEVATFYTMFNLSPVGKVHVQLCGTTPCRLRGADDLEKVCRKRIGDQNEISKDGKFSWVEVECLGACVNAPVVQVNDDFFEDLDKDNLKAALRKLKAGEQPKPGPQNGRHASEPAGGALTLKSIAGSSGVQS